MATLSAVVRLVGGLPNEELKLFLYFCLRLTLSEFVIHVGPTSCGATASTVYGCIYIAYKYL